MRTVVVMGFGFAAPQQFDDFCGGVFSSVLLFNDCKLISLFNKINLIINLLYRIVFVYV